VLTFAIALFAFREEFGAVPKPFNNANNPFAHSLATVIRGVVEKQADSPKILSLSGNGLMNARSFIPAVFVLA